jgi:hypothetical protein
MGPVKRATAVHNERMKLTLRQAKPGGGGRGWFDDPRKPSGVSQQVQVLPGEGDHPPVASLAWWWGNPPCEA